MSTPINSDGTRCTIPVKDWLEGLKAPKEQTMHGVNESYVTHLIENIESNPCGMRYDAIKRIAIHVARMCDQMSDTMLAQSLGIVPPIIIVTSEEEKARIVREFEERKADATKEKIK